MIGKQFKNRSFRSTLDYVLGKEKAITLDSNMGGTTPRQLASEFGAARKLKPNLQRACAHVILSIPHRDASHEKGDALIDKNRTAFSKLVSGAAFQFDPNALGGRLHPN